MGLRRGFLLPAGLLGAAVALVPSVASSETPSIEAVNTGLYGHAWSPTQAAVAAGGTVAIRNPTAIPHGVQWHSGPETPVCNGIPVGTTPSAAGTNWSGTCTFSKPGTYVFYCTVHGPEMTETVTVAGSETTPTTQPTTTTPPPPTAPTTTTPPPAGVEQQPIVGSPSLRFAQRGALLRGSLRVARAGRLEVDVFARPHARRVRVGRLVHGGVSAGRLSFAVALDAQARRALAHSRRLALSVRITLTPIGGRPSTVKRTVVDHA